MQPAVNVAVFPSASYQTPMTVNGRKYSCPVGSAPILVPECDAFVLLANGWQPSALNAAGTTAQRPVGNHALGISPPPIGYRYFDTSLSITVIWTGLNWINFATGAVA